MTDELKQWEYDKGYTKGYLDGRASLIEELEKIKEEIEKLNNTDYGSMFSYESHQGAGYMQDDIINIIERHISELKGD